MKSRTAILFTLLTAALPLQIFGQDRTPCVKIKIASNTKKISIASINDVIINYTLENCKKETLLIDTLEMVDYESTYSKIYFKLFRCDSSNGCVEYPYRPQDYQRILFGGDKQLNKTESFTYSFDLFHFYKIDTPGNYRIIGFYKESLFNDKTGTDGFYLQESNSISIVVTK